jgi:undecaprenyl diphosphate synthase
MVPPDAAVAKIGEISTSSLAHLAIIMDGNGRWAKARGLPRTAGHQQGAEAVRRTVKAAVKHGIRFLTLYGFSSENWKRPKQEVRDLMGLLRVYLRREIKALGEEGVRFKVIGDRQMLDSDIVALIAEAERSTAENDRLVLTIALSYGSRAEITRAVKRIAEDAAEGRVRPDEVDEALIDNYLYTAGIPDPDLLIRTSGEQRISNFLLWQLAYTEFLFLENHWPDFSETDLTEAIKSFQARDRRYGATTAS